jgi:hypothetical protein
MLKAVGLLLIAAVVTGAGCLTLTEPFAIDGCLDGGGAWDYAKKACRYQ